MVPGTSFKQYPKYNYSPHKPGRKSAKNTSLDLIDLSQKNPFVFKGDPGRPRVSIPAKITPISQHHHIKTTTQGRYLIYRNSEKVQNNQIAGRESIIYGITLKLSKGVLKEVLPSKEKIKDPKRIKGKTTVWKYSEYAVPICRPEKPY
jgi:hypothetical protein